MTTEPPLEWIFDRAQPEALRLRPAALLVAALRAGRPVHVDGAVIDGEVDLDSVDYPHKLVVQNTVFLGHLHLTEGRFAHTVDFSGCEFRQNVNFFATRVDGQLKLPRARICRGTRPPIQHNFDQVEVTGRLNGTLLVSEVALSLRQARLGEIGFDGIQIDGGLDLQIASVTGDVFCQATEGRLPAISGQVRLAGTRIGGALSLDGRLFDTAGQKVDPPEPRLRRRFFRLMLTGGEEPVRGARLALDRVRVSRLEISERIPDGISADGMVFDDLELPPLQGACEYSELLRRTRPFKRSTYLAVEAWLHNKGLDKAAKRVYIQMSERDLVTGRSSRFSRWAKWLLLGATIGYGARPLRLVWLFAISFALSLWVFSQPQALASYNERRADSPDSLPAEKIDAAVTLGAALRCHFPMLLFVGEPNYVPSPQPIPGLGVRYDAYALGVSTVSWVLVPLFLAGLTGIVRQKR